MATVPHRPNSTSSGSRQDGNSAEAGHRTAPVPPAAAVHGGSGPTSHNQHNNAREPSSGSPQPPDRQSKAEKLRAAGDQMEAAAPPPKSSKLAMFKKYGIPFSIYLTSAYLVTGVLSYIGVGIAGEEAARAMVLSIARDTLGWESLAQKIETLDPVYSRLTVAIAVNELLEIVRLPLVLVTFPFIIRRLNLKPSGSTSSTTAGTQGGSATNKSEKR